jgi:hypothetical protein
MGEGKGLYTLLVAWCALALYFPALKWRASRRLPFMLLLAAVVLLAPLLVSPEQRIARFMTSLLAVLMVFKMWALHLAAKRGDRPDARQMLGFAVNPFFLVWARRGAERQPTRKQVFIDFVIADLNVIIGALVTLMIIRASWPPGVFLIQHTLILTGLMWTAIAWMSVSVAITRLCGGYCVSAHDRPWLARTPADWWRRYNRLIGSFLHECVFKVVGGRRHPVRGTLVAFAVSGVLHEYIFWLAAGRSPGLQMVFFMLQGAAVAATLRVRPKGASAVVWTGATFIFFALSSVIFMASFHHFLPVYLHGLPGWLAAY